MTKNIDVDIASGTVTLDISGTFTPEQAHQLVNQIANAAARVQPVPSDFQPQHFSTRVPDAWAWYCIHTATGQLLLALRHPDLGWIGNLIPNLDAIKVGHGIEHQIATFNTVVLANVVKQISQGGKVPDVPAGTVPSGGSNTVH